MHGFADVSSVFGNTETSSYERGVVTRSATNALLWFVDMRCGHAAICGARRGEAKRSDAMREGAVDRSCWGVSQLWYDMCGRAQSCILSVGTLRARVKVNVWVGDFR
jgi:hypothetical protein